MTDEEESAESEFGSSIETRRLALRPPAPEDEAAIALLSASPRIADGLATLPCPGRNDIGETFAIVERSNGLLIGSAMYGSMTDRPAATEAACWIGEPHWGRGYATEAMQAVIDRAFADRRIHTLWCSNRVMNERGRRVIEKCGFQFRETGMARSPILRGAVAVERFALERRNWQALRAWGTATIAKAANKSTGYESRKDLA
jgi:RimJ/RimL family protein N-acetyltransferase